MQHIFYDFPNTCGAGTWDFMKTNVHPPCGHVGLKGLIPYHDDLYINIGMHIVKGSKTEKLLGIDIDNNLHFDKHVSILCDKASQNLHALARISK